MLLNVSSIFYTKVSQKYWPERLKLLEKCNIFKILSKNCNFKILSKMKVMESIVYVISQLILFGDREIVQEGGEVLLKVLPTISAIFHVYFGSCIKRRFVLI